MNVHSKLDPLPKITLKKDRERSISLGHHWVFSGAIERTDIHPQEGDLVRVVSKDGADLGLAFYGKESIALRILSQDSKRSLSEIYKEKISNAFKLRSELNLINDQTDSYRIFHSEGDFIPGLTIDKYNSTLVIQAHHLGILKHLDFIQQALLDSVPDIKCIVLLDEASRENKRTVIFGDAPSTEIKEYGINYNLDIFKGQKTGFFLDQRENRLLLRSLAKNKSVLNLYAYSGGFSLNALKGGAKEVISVEASPIAVDLLNENIKLNKLTNAHTALKTDCTEYLKQETKLLDIVIQDPPALVKRRQDLKNGLSYYRGLTGLTLNRVKPGGLLMSYSCSQFVTSEMLLLESLKAAKKEGKKLQILKKLYQAPCHPINPCHPESEYLKGFLFRVV
jgi:23S rRNA (cytosine1962-C5)-methyltransferase